MIKFLSTLAGKVIVGLVLLVLVLLVLRSCDSNRREAAQSKVEQGQAGAARESAGDAINTQGEVGQRATESEELTRRNTEEIRNAKGADQPVDPAVSAAGRDSLCRRPAYRDHPSCRVQ